MDRDPVSRRASAPFPVRPRPHLRPSALGMVAVGGALGASVRHALSVWVPDSSSGFPWTTFAINLAGSFLLGLLPAFSAVRRSVHLPLLLGPGVLGGFTTLSTYSEQTRDMVADGSLGTAMAYVIGTFIACLVAVAVADQFSDTDARAEFEAEEGDL